MSMIGASSRSMFRCCPLGNRSLHRPHRGSALFSDRTAAVDSVSKRSRLWPSKKWFLAMNNELNKYGDNYKVISAYRGSDISSQRVDELEKTATLYAAQHEHQGILLDLGCGVPVQSARFALLGKKVLAVDICDFSQQVETIRGLFPFMDIKFLNKRLEELADRDIWAPVSCIFSQRAIHYLHPRAAQDLISWLREKSEPGCKCFVSASGIDSELGEHYQGKAVEWKKRYCELSVVNQKKHGIGVRVCLYGESDLMNLMERNDFKCETIYLSDFGNVKGIFSAPP